MTEIGAEVFTPLGRGKVVYLLPDSTVVVEFPHGGGQIFFREELLRRVVRWDVTRRTREYDDLQKAV